MSKLYDILNSMITRLKKVETTESDWNASEGEAGHVKNRTHYEETTVVNEPLNITWDGNTEGLVQIEALLAFKVSDVVLTDEQLKSCTMMLSNGNSALLSDVWDEFTSGGYVYTTDELTAINENILIIVRKAGLEINGVIFPETGIYFGIKGSMYVTSLTTTEPVPQTKTVVHKLDKKFLPDDVGGMFKVNVSYDEANSAWVSDKTYDEITAAEEAKMPIVGTFTNKSGQVFTLIGCDEEEAHCQLSAFNVSSNSAPIIYRIKICADRTAVTELALTATATALT